MGCCSAFAKIFLFIINFLILLGAIALIVLGVIYHINSPGISLSIFAIVVGVVIALISFFGCFGACSGNGCLLTTYAVILLLIFIVQVVLGILAFVYIQNDDGQLTTEVVKFLDGLYRDYGTTADHTEVVDQLQRFFECCGIYGNSTTTEAWYSSCCPTSVETCSPNNAFRVPCSIKLLEFMETFAIIIGGIALGFAVFELIAAGLACLAKKRNDDKYY